MMKKAVFILILILGITFSVFCQNSGPMDLVVLLDTSASMSNSYYETSDYLIGPFLKEFLRIGDTFHLISFAGTPKLEISRRVEAAGDVEALIGRLLLMYPLDPGSDVAGALKFAETYASSLPGNRHRKLVLISDGDAAETQNLVNEASARLTGQGASLQFIKVPVTGTGPSSGRPAQTAPVRQPPARQLTQTPGPAESSPGVTAPARQPQNVPAPAAQTQPARQTQSASGTPGSAQQPQSGSTPAAPPQSSARPVSGLTPESAPAESRTPSQPGTAPSQPGSLPSAAENLNGSRGDISGTEPRAADTAPRPADPSGAQPSTGQSSVPSGTASPVSPPPSSSAPAGGSSAQSPQTAQTVTQPSRPPEGSSFFSGDIPLPLIIALAALAMLILGLIIFFAVRRLHESPNRVMAQAAAPLDARDRIEAQRQEQMRGVEMMGSFAETQRKNTAPPLEYPPPQKKPMPKDMVYAETQVDDGPLMLNLFVEDQNTAIGRRNIHVVKGGYTFSVGGGKSDFLIFLVPIPPHIADVHFDGRNCTFIPRKPQYFPDIGSQQVSGCIGKTIRVISDKNYELFIRIEKYQDPLKTLNNLLRSIQVPGV